MTNKIDLTKLISTTEAGLRLGVSRMRVVQLIKEDRLPAVKAGRDWLIDPADLNLVAARKVGRPPKKEIAAAKKGRKKRTP